MLCPMLTFILAFSHFRKQFGLVFVDEWVNDEIEVAGYHFFQFV